MDIVRFLQGTAAAAALALTGYIVVEHVIDKKPETTTATSQQAPAQKTAPDILSYVPADTIYFVGGLEPAPVKDMLNSMPPEWQSMQHVDIKQDFSPEKLNSMSPAVKMLIGLFIEYMQALKDPSTTASTLGIGDEFYSALYSVGTTPVLRIQLSDSNAFNQLVQRAENIALVSPAAETHNGLNFSTYSFQRPGSTSANPTSIKLVIHTNKDYALITLFMDEGNISNTSLRDIVLGSKKPVSPLSKTNVLQEIQNKHGFKPSYLGYLNHEEIMKGLTSPNSNDFGRMLSTLFENARAMAAAKQEQAGAAESALTEQPSMPENPLAPIQTAACQKELMAMTQTWPRTVFGYTKMDLNKKPMQMDMRMLMENTDPAFMQELQKLRGHIPANLLRIDSKPVFGLGLGFNIDALTPVASQVMSEFTKKEYQCQILAEAKQKLLTSNPLLAMGMMTGMAAGLQGISASILDFDADMNITEQGAQPNIRSLDAIITLSAKDPQRLLAMAANFQQGMPPIQVPSDGTAVDLAIPLPAPNLGPVKLAQKGSHLVAYIGEKATQLAQTMTSEPLAATGMIAFSLDFGRYMKFVSDMALNAEGPQGKVADQLSAQDKAMFEQMSKTNAQINETFDITPQGLAFDVKMSMN